MIAQATVRDPEQYEGYKALAGAAVARYGGKYVVRGGATHLLEGDWAPPRLVILEFESVEQAKRFYDSPEYRAARERRHGAALMNMLVVEGL
ncbi:MAG: hypothetical protein AMXMBFR31_10650 [Candidatus Desulfobacillus denitrificans]|uniref:DUF1330 domain-containing protein n=1 Tax=Candidatus Desulfobacillus denitrificans TaxID=2608985 RepID=A0A809RVV6_9PROT|nr:conserved hypothetical protein [Candidatus Desulfobacillus denitrificans]GIK46897.1 MAG: hypothetical protein BroJett012_28000 [Betaproteobacteria bacterium]GJQ56280.1 MAG: hypothetical protein HKUEN07_28490 [Rhodocyclaceae bacterium]